MEIKHESLGVDIKVKDDLRQKHIEALMDAFDGENTQGIVRYHGAIVRSAIIAGWIESPAMKAEDVGDMYPAVIRFVGEALDKIYSEITEIPPN